MVMMANTSLVVGFKSISLSYTYRRKIYQQANVFTVAPFVKKKIY
jgi:hypothetical protein